MTSEPDETAEVSPAGSSYPKAETASTGPSPTVLISDVTGSDADKIKAEDGRRTLTQYEKTLSSQAENNHSANTLGVDDGGRIFYSAARALAKQLKGAAQQAAKNSLGAQDHVDAIKAADVAASAVDKAEALGHSGGLSFSA